MTRLMTRPMALLIVLLTALRAVAAPAIAVVPQPQEIQAGQGQFTLAPATAILVDPDSAELLAVGHLLAERIHRGTGLKLKVAAAAQSKQAGAIRITTAGADTALGAEGYRLTVAPDVAVIAGGSAAGAFYGTQTLLQLLPPEVFRRKAEAPVAWSIPVVEIKDQPRFRWRGLLLDVARHMFTKEEMKNYIDLMAQHKLNTLQIHLTDDQGWRVEIKRYPRLTEVGAWRKSISFGLDPKQSTSFRGDGCYGGFFSQDDVRELVAYAKARYVTIVPEIEMPGHAGAALSVYPELSCFGGPYNRDGGPMGIFCPGNDETFRFLEGVIDEAAGLFPGPYLHIGGDEVGKDQWTKCPKCKERMKREGLKDVHELQSYFVKRIERLVNARGRALIGWDEILEGGLAPNATVMSWRSSAAGAVAARAGHDVVMTPTSHCYLDYYQAKSGEPRGIGGFVPLKLVYDFEPVPQGVPADKTRHILGAGGNLWTEFVPNYSHAQYMTYPRACALAELTWTDVKRKDWGDFTRRLEVQMQRLKIQGVNYRAPRKGTDPGYE